MQELFGNVMEVAIAYQREALNLLLGATWQIVTKLVCLRADRSLRRSTNQPKFPSIYWFEICTCLVHVPQPFGNCIHRQADPRTISLLWSTAS